MKEKPKHNMAYELWFELLMKQYNTSKAINYISQKFNVRERTVWRWHDEFDWKNRATKRFYQINKSKESIKNSEYAKTKDEIDLIIKLYDEIYDLKHYIKDIFKKPVLRSSPEYNIYVKQILKRDSKCQCCGSFENLEVHHILPFNLYNSLGDDINNGIVLCEHCHKEYHHIYSWKGNCNSITLIEFIKNNQNTTNEIQAKFRLNQNGLIEDVEANL